MDMLDVEEELRAIQERNRRVEAEKAWEVSSTRRSFIAVVTYFTACFLFWLLRVPLFYVHALVPSGAYLLSTWSLPRVKRAWMRRHQQ